MSKSQSWTGQSLWQDKLGNVRNLVRQELVTRQLVEHLPPAEDLSVLDVGCGQGTQLLELARKGYLITGVDISSDLLAQAEADLGEQPSDVQARVKLVQGDIHHLDQAVDQKFDVVLCHGVLMYMPSLDESLKELKQVLAPGGLLSVLTRNRFSIAMRAGMSGDWPGALDGFDARHYDNRVGVTGTRADEPAEVIEGLKKLKVDLVAWYGVRLFTDHWGDIKPSKDFDQLLAAEEEAGKRDPYRQLTSLTHVIGVSKV
jgi:ubiquinone/menaquinone biosynthesis C-methylase UbiE